MSAFAGFYTLDGSQPSANSALLSEIAKGIAQLGTDSEVCDVMGPVAMVYKGFGTRSSNSLENQPFRDSCGLVLAWDGRLDDGVELARALGFEQPKSDVELVAAAYSKWGLDALPKLIGDFALAVWDPCRNRLILARDPCTARPLFYHENCHHLIWASTIRAIVDHLPRSFDVDPHFIAGHLAIFQGNDHTPYSRDQNDHPGTRVHSGKR